MKRVSERSHWAAMVSATFPYPPYLWKVVRQSALLWVLARLTYSVIFWLATDDLAVALHPNWITRIFLIAVAAFLVWWDRKRAHEVLLPANLGAAPEWFWTASLLAALVLDVTLQTLLRLL
jgi:hypothetical protein